MRWINGKPEHKLVDSDDYSSQPFGGKGVRVGDKIILTMVHIGGIIPPTARGPHRPCQYPGCEEYATASCDPCGKDFCADHGSSERNVPGICEDAAICWACGGYNADE